MKVLIVEAEQWLADWVSGLLPEAKISHARNGLLALRELTDCPNIPELIILNADLPDIGGDLLLNTIHADPRTASMPAICLCDSQAQCDRMQVAGAYAVLSIPLGLFALRYTVKTLLTEKSNIRNSFEGAVVDLTGNYFSLGRRSFPPDQEPFLVCYSVFSPPNRRPRW